MRAKKGIRDINPRIDGDCDLNETEIAALLIGEEAKALVSPASRGPGRSPFYVKT